MESRRQDRFWNQLIAIINKGNVVPIVGEDLLRLPDEQYFYTSLAKRYAKYSNIEFPPGEPVSLSSIVRSHPDFRDNPHDIYQEVGEEYDYWNPDIPPSLLELAKITKFNLFVSTTFDNLLEKAINQIRFNGAERTVVIPYSPKNIPRDSLFDEALASERPVIIQLFGHYKNPLQFALTEGDKVEYMHALQSMEYCPKRIFNELHERPLLMLGNKFPDWLSRSFLRMTRRTALDDRNVPKQIFADTEINEDPILKFFLQRFTTNTELIENLDPIQFTIELASKWQSGSVDSFTDTLQLSENQLSKPMPRNSVFISYSASNPDGSVSKDTKLAIKLKNALEDVGVVAWLDVDQLQGGDEYERKIKQYINTCSIFIPIVSATTNARMDAFFRNEWSWAIKRLEKFTGANRQFLMPIGFGDIDPYTALVPEEFSRYQYMMLDEEGPDVNAISRIKAVYESITNNLAMET